MTAGATLAEARALAARGDDAPAIQAYLRYLASEPTDLAALNELGTLALAGGYRSAATTAYRQAALHHPQDPATRVNLGHVLRLAGDPGAAREHYLAALAVDPAFAPAHQGLCWALDELGLDGGQDHARRGFAGHARRELPYRGTGTALPVLLLASARGGNVPTEAFIDDRSHRVTVLYVEYAQPDEPLPADALVVNAIGDADRCDEALACADRLLAGYDRPVINAPARVRATGRLANAQRLGGLAGVVTPQVRRFDARGLRAFEPDRWPVLVRRPGFHTGQHFLRADDRAALDAAPDVLGGTEFLAIEYLDARGSDGLSRKYRVLFIDGVAYPLHLAASHDWKVHYYSSAMAEQPSLRDEEARFLDDMAGVLGPRATAALASIQKALGLDYGGIDFAIGGDGTVLVFEANATMVIASPDADPRWNYRRRAIEAARRAARRLLEERARR